MEKKVENKPDFTALLKRVCYHFAGSVAVGYDFNANLTFERAWNEWIKDGKIKQWHNNYHGNEVVSLEMLTAFKTYVHDRLDKMGVPSNPEPENNAAHGCRIEGRLNWVENENARLKQELHELKVKQFHEGGHSLGVDVENAKLKEALRELFFEIRGRFADDDDKAFIHMSTPLNHIMIKAKSLLSDNPF